jgi:hypothetical protein
MFARLVSITARSHESGSKQPNMSSSRRQRSWSSRRPKRISLATVQWGFIIPSDVSHANCGLEGGFALEEVVAWHPKGGNEVDESGMCRSPAKAVALAHETTKCAIAGIGRGAESKSGVSWPGASAGADLLYATACARVTTSEVSASG